LGNIKKGTRMNANELADELWVCLESSIISDSDTRDLIMEAATMLRQQQAVIKNLMDLVDIQKGVSRDVDIDFLNLTISQQQAEIEALKAKTLTNEEIARIFEEVYKYKASNLNMDFARAILRKANEK